MKKLQKKIIVSGDIEILTGMYIGGTNDQMGIGGLDNLIIRNPLTQLPIIPGSSLKGKMRALVELVRGAYNTSNDPKKLGGVGSDPEVTVLFGMSADKKDMGSHASRLVVRDAVLSNTADAEWENTPLPYSEVKTEAVINRLTSAATPRSFERLPAGAKFEFEMIVNIVCEDNETDETTGKLLRLLSEGMHLLQDDYLGGNGSRGYGKIAFKNLQLTEKTYYPELTEKPVEDAKISELFADFK